QNAPRVRIFGSGALAERAATEARPRLEQMGLAVERTTQFKEENFGIQGPPDLPLSPASALAVRHLAGEAAALEVPPPPLRAWQPRWICFSPYSVPGSSAKADTLPKN